MNIIPMMIAMSTFLGVGFTVAFIIFIKRGQFDDCETPAHRILFDHETQQNMKRKELNK